MSRNFFLGGGCSFGPVSFGIDWPKKSIAWGQQIGGIMPYGGRGYAIRTLGRRIRRAELAYVSWGGRAVLTRRSCCPSVGYTPLPAPAAPPKQSPPRRETRTPRPAPPPPPEPTKPKKPPTHKGKSFASSSNSSSDHALPRGHGKEVKGKQPHQQKRREEPPSLEGDESPHPLLGEHVFVPYTAGVYPGVVTSVVEGGRRESVGGTPRGKRDVSG